MIKKYRKAAASAKLEYYAFLRECGMSELDFPFERCTYSQLDNAIETCWRVVSYEDLGTSILGWCAWAVQFKEVFSGERETLVVEYSGTGENRKVVGQFLATKNRK